ncbi:hypothetical protein LIER_40402 [Lithospermum erythrorhizon]|uniref:Retrovirus-related Pol polyprotein from transposon TNT 1-94-like beta-barrel domain-containing protein n=1 Tax=Lithospermum erythrorhizon TaxID=34254 RepID=A0AAV3QVJ4_LITER
MKRVEEQRVEICSLEEKILGMIKEIKMMNSNTAVLDEILLQGKRSADNTGIGFSGESRTKRMMLLRRIWVATGTKPNLNSERNGCSRHMTRNKSYLSKVEIIRGYYVTFGGGEKGKIIGKGSLNVKGLSELEEVLLVEGLTTNLISISQCCDNGMKVSFSKKAFCVNNFSDQLIMEGNRSFDNCKFWTPQKALHSRTQEEGMDRIHQRKVRYI